MKRIFYNLISRIDRISQIRRIYFVCLVGVMLSCLSTTALINEPDVLVYGSIWMDGAPVTSANTGVKVEVRRDGTGAVLGSYTMGSNQQYGDTYALLVNVEDIAPLTIPESIALGSSVSIVVTSGGVDIYTQGVTAATRAQSILLDFGSATDQDFDGMDDADELTFFLSLDEGPDGDFDGDGNDDLGTWRNQQ